MCVCVRVANSFLLRDYYTVAAAALIRPSVNHPYTGLLLYENHTHTHTHFPLCMCVREPIFFFGIKLVLHCIEMCFCVSLIVTSTQTHTHTQSIVSLALI